MIDPLFKADQWPELFNQNDPQQARRVFLPAELQTLQKGLTDWLQIPRTSLLESETLNSLFQSWQLQPTDLGLLTPGGVNQALSQGEVDLPDLLSLLYAVCLNQSNSENAEDWQRQIQTQFLPRLQQQETRLQQEIEQIYLQGLADTKWHFLPFVLDADVLGPKTLKVRGSQIREPEQPFKITALQLPVLNWWSWNPITLILNRRYLRVLRQAERRFGSLDYFFKQFTELSRSLVFNYMANLARQGSDAPLDHITVQRWKTAFEAVFSTDYSRLDQAEMQAGYLTGKFLQDLDQALDLLVAAATGLEKSP